MIQLPGQIVSDYRLHLLKRRVIDEDIADYLKWLRYFHDYCAKYHVEGDNSHRIRLFIGKLQEKKQSEGQLRRAYNAVMLYFEMLKQEWTPMGKVASSRTFEMNDLAVISEVAAQQSVNTVRRSHYSEAGYQEKSDSPEWDAVLANMAGEIKVRHYSRKTLKTYASWSRKFQRFLNNKSPEELTSIEVNSI